MTHTLTPELLITVITPHTMSRVPGLTELSDVSVTRSRSRRKVEAEYSPLPPLSQATTDIGEQRQAETGSVASCLWCHECYHHKYLAWHVSRLTLLCHVTSLNGLTMGWWGERHAHIAHAQLKNWDVKLKDCNKLLGTATLFKQTLSLTSDLFTIRCRARTPCMAV